MEKGENEFDGHKVVFLPFKKIVMTMYGICDVRRTHTTYTTVTTHLITLKRPFQEKETPNFRNKKLFSIDFKHLTLLDSHETAAHQNTQRLNP